MENKDEDLKFNDSFNNTDVNYKSKNENINTELDGIICSIVNENKTNAHNVTKNTSREDKDVQVSPSMLGLVSKH